MLPRHALLRRTLLRSERSGSVFDPDALVMRFGGYTAGNAIYEPGMTPPAEPPVLQDDSALTSLHEGMHWRQLHGTTLGAFLSWLKHAREIDTFEKIQALPPARRTALLRARREGQALLRLDDEGQPEPPIVLDDPVDEVELLRCTFFDNFLLGRLFTDPEPIVRPHADFGQIFESALADAATAMARYHPAWREHEYAAVQGAYRMSEPLGRVRLNEEPGTPELTTHGVMEAGAISNELLMDSFVREERYHAPGGPATSLVTPVDEPDMGRFQRQASWFLGSGHGLAVRAFVLHCRLDPWNLDTWATVSAVADFALNPPLPPISGPPARPLAWRDLYPPLRFLLASRAVRRIGPLAERASGAEVAAYLARLAEASGLSAVPAEHPEDRPDGTTDFAAVIAGKREGELLRSRLNYYDLVLWCQVMLWRTRRTEPRLLTLPGMLCTDLGALAGLLVGKLGMAPVVSTDESGELWHARASSPGLGSWLATSVLVWAASQDLVMGEGAMDGLGMPAAVMGSEDVRRVVRATLRTVCGEDPYEGTEG